jgi:outer membrane protein
MFSRALLPYALAATASLFVTAAAAQPTTAPSTVPAPAAAAVPMRFAVLDTRHVILNSEEGLRVQANLRKLTESKQSELAQKDRDLTEEQEKLRQEEKSKGSSPALDKRKADWRQKVAALQQAQLDFQRDMLQKEGELTKPMVQKIGNIVKNIAQQESYDLVVDKNAVVFFRNDLDITERVLTLYNQGTAGSAPAPKKAPKDKAPAKKEGAAPGGGAKKPR